MTGDVCSNKEYGSGGELAAGKFFEDQGFEIVRKNFRCGRVGEIDLIVRKGDLFVFAEVKTRSTQAFGGGLYSLGAKKKLRMRKTADFFITTVLAHDTVDIVFRFDLVNVDPDGIEWIQDILR